MICGKAADGSDAGGSRADDGAVATVRWHGLPPESEIVRRENGALLGPRANYFRQGQASLSYAVLDIVATKRLRRSLRQK